MSTIDTSNIDPTKPTSGSATTQSVRDNFSQIKTALDSAKTDIVLIESGAASMSALRGIDITNLADGYMIHLLGHTNAGDGGGGLFRLAKGASTGTYTDDNGITIVPTGGDGSSAWIRLHDDLIDVKWYGASSSGSASSNTTAIQKAIDNNAGKVIVITRGIPYTRSSLTGISGSGGASLLDLSRNDETGAGLDVYPHLSVGGDIDVYPFSGGNPELTFKNGTGYGSGVDQAIISTNPTSELFQILIPNSSGVMGSIFEANTNNSVKDPRFTINLAIDRSSGSPTLFLRENGSVRARIEYLVNSNEFAIAVVKADGSTEIRALYISGEDDNPAIRFPELTTKPAAPSSGIKLYCRNAGSGVKLYAQDPSGTETALT